jgi:NADPH-dependent 2,4-dienoyl-CoA reductase/sulfur reductase-like enzyme
MATRVPNVWAAGDCVETWHRLLGRHTYLPLGTTAHKQGRIAGENALGGSRPYEGTLGTQVVKVFGTVVGRTGLSENEAREAGLDATTAEVTTWDHKAYYPGAQALYVRLVADRATGRMLGAQILGSHPGEISKRIDVLAVALHHGMSVEAMSDLDLSYTPPLSSPWDPVQAAAQAWEQSERARARST